MCIRDRYDIVFELSVLDTGVGDQVDLSENGQVPTSNGEALAQSLDRLFWETSAKTRQEIFHCTSQTTTPSDLNSKIHPRNAKKPTHLYLIKTVYRSKFMRHTNAIQLSLQGQSSPKH
eukprot:TRINITY_DN10115_c0_g1_i1.p1 TRINITY_DN10115_c0_g1~~TRINITY_DN10115_c0_g1_i1.p1  ORF type:complete len:118 (-),score=8.60 TRINITY_DN10115_c0_g1_i1:82-435(-)